jgi:hypothetical protein
VVDLYHLPFPLGVPTQKDDLTLELERSRKLVGELYPVLVDQHGTIISGNHRLAAGWKSRQKIVVKDKLDELMKRQAAMIQHQNVANDHIALLREMCEEVEKKGIPKHKVGKYVVDHCSALHKTYTYELIPNEYKVQTKPCKEKIPLAESTITGIQNIGGTTVRVRESPAMVPTLDRVVCPTCQGKGYLVE